VLVRDFADDMQSVKDSLAPALEAGRYPLMNVWLGLWSSPVAKMAVRMFF
jgi:hypothetical protein